MAALSITYPASPDRGVAFFRDAIQPGTLLDAILYARASGRAQAGKGNSLLKAKAEQVATEAERKGMRIVETVLGVEKGYVHIDRPHLERAVDAAHWHGVPYLLAPELSRFIRARDYHRARNPFVEPTPEEYALLHRRTPGLGLLTLASPWLTESERQSINVRRSQKAGPPVRITDELTAQMFEMAGWLVTNKHRRHEWERSLRSVAKHFCAKGVPVSAMWLSKLAKSESTVVPGYTWEELARAKALEDGIPDYAEGGWG